MGMSIKIEGAQELRTALLALPEKIAKRAMRDALIAGANVVLPVAQENCPSDSGALRDSLHVKMYNYGNGIAADIEVGAGDRGIQKQLHKIWRGAYQAAGGRHNQEESLPAGKAARKKGEAHLKALGIKQSDWQGTFYGKFIEYGFEHKGGTQVQGKHFLEQALESTQSQATDAIANHLKEFIEAEGLK